MVSGGRDDSRFGASDGAVDDFNPAELGEAGSLYLTYLRLKDHLFDADTLQARGGRALRRARDGTLSLSLGRRYAMEQAGLTHADLEERKTEGKPLLDIAADTASTGLRGLPGKLRWRQVPRRRWLSSGAGVPVGRGQARSNRSRFITLVQALTKERTKFPCASLQA